MVFPQQEQDKQEIIAIISKHMPHAAIFLFGSRARQDHTPESDFDVAIDNHHKVDTSTLSTIREDLEESLIPFTVDVVDFNNISDTFKSQILKDMIIWKK